MKLNKYFLRRKNYIKQTESQVFYFIFIALKILFF